jgi:hypothetical protein
VWRIRSRKNVYGGITTTAHSQRFLPEIIDLNKETNSCTCQFTIPDKYKLNEGRRLPDL